MTGALVHDSKKVTLIFESKNGALVFDSEIWPLVVDCSLGNLVKNWGLGVSVIGPGFESKNGALDGDLGFGASDKD